jgi:hypothetical protein
MTFLRDILSRKGQLYGRISGKLNFTRRSFVLLLTCGRLRSILHDETLYPLPFTFLPERFLDEKGRLSTSAAAEAANIAFGFGRRICPGLYLAENSVFLGIATILAVFDIRRTVDEMGREVVPEVEYDGFIR